VRSDTATRRRDLLTGHMRMGIACLTSNLEIFGEHTLDGDHLASRGRKVEVIVDRADL